MQSTGHCSMQLRSMTSTQAWVTTYVIALLGFDAVRPELRTVAASWPNTAADAIRCRSGAVMNSRSTTAPASALAMPC